MVSRKEWYRRVNDQWPDQLPKPTPEQAVNAARRLYRWAMGHTWTGPVRVTSGNRFTWISRGVFNVNPDHRGHGGGWQALVHDLSHYCWWSANHGQEKAHDKGHAKLELAMIKQVIKRGWLNPQPEAVKEKAPPPTKDQIRGDRYERLKAREMSWVRKERRAQNALKKLRRQMRYYERQVAA